MSLFDDFMTRGARLRGVTVRQSKFRGHSLALWLGSREIAHCHNDQADIRLTREVVRELGIELRSDARIDLRRSGSDWILVRLRREADVERALMLLRRAMRA
ncbi:MAG: luciferase family protein [Candidatus Limnocylindria bacterium]